jgi:ATP-binding cassette subfamily B (MDR/TAP) protein 1
MSTAAAAAAKLYETIEAKPAIDSASITGLRLPRESLRGELAFRHVDFRYPARPDRPVFSDLSVTFAARQVTAICGESGAGKSSAIALIERFYDYHGGDITLDGVSIRDLNLRWLRGQIGLVQQEPVLLSGTVYDNVVSGLMETPFENAPDEEKRLLAVEACKKANAHAFVSSLPEGYDTRIGERGVRSLRSDAVH